VEKGGDANVAERKLTDRQKVFCRLCAEGMKPIEAAKKAGYKTVVSHRSGDTEDAFIADLAVAANADFIKAGAPARSERVAKYNRILQIEQELCFL
jgi:enolase